MVDLVDQPSGNGVTAAAAQWWSAEQCPDDAQGQGGPTDRPDLHQTIPNPRSIYAKAERDYLQKRCHGEEKTHLVTGLNLEHSLYMYESEEKS